MPNLSYRRLQHRRVDRCLRTRGQSNFRIGLIPDKPNYLTFLGKVLMEAGLNKGFRGKVIKCRFLNFPNYIEYLKAKDKIRRFFRIHSIPYETSIRNTENYTEGCFFRIPCHGLKTKLRTVIKTKKRKKRTKLNEADIIKGRVLTILEAPPVVETITREG